MTDVKDDRSFVLALAGNPNCGKTTLFNVLTGSRQKVGNWPGVTVEKKTGSFSHAGKRYEVIDLPGTYSLQSFADDDAIDEQIAKHYLLANKPDVIINVIDASSVERGLLLTTELVEAGVPVVVAMNMMDIADSQGVHINHLSLSEQLGCPVVPLIATRKEGINSLLDLIHDVIINHSLPQQQVPLDKEMQGVVDEVKSFFGDQEIPRLHVSRLLDGDKQFLATLTSDVQQAIDRLLKKEEQEKGVSLSDRLVGARYQWIDKLVAAVVSKDASVSETLSDRIDHIVLNRFVGIPLFFFVMYLMFMFTINVGGALIDVFDIVVGAVMVDGLAVLLESWHFPQWVVMLLSGGVGGGVQTVATFIPVIACLFLFLSFLEDSGYLARAAFIIDRALRRVGLPGKSFVPLIVGFGCSVPAVMAARTLENQKDRLLTTIMAPFMSCGARLTVYALFAAVFFPVNGQNVVFGLYLIGIVVAVLSGLVLKKHMLQTDASPFIMELPPYHIPHFRSLLLHTWGRLKGFVVRAGKAIVFAVVILHSLNSIGTDGSFGNEDTDQSVLAAIGKSLTVVLEPMGVQEDNWPATVGIFTGIFAKEVVVGTLDALYTQIADQANSDDSAEEEGFELWPAVKEGFATVPENLAGLKDTLSDPFGMNIGDVSDAMTAAQDQEVELTTFSLMHDMFDGPLSAFAYLLFILLYIPCVATVGAIMKELGVFWAAFISIWSTGLAYCVAVTFYQLATFSQHPGSSMVLLISVWAFLLLGFALLIRLGRKHSRVDDLIPAINIS